MRRLGLVVIAMLVASNALAQKNELSVFRTAQSSSSDGGNVGIAFNRALTPRISAELTIGHERHRSYSYIVNPNGTFTAVSPAHFRTHPIDLTAQYHWLNETRWKPYLGAGLRYVAAPGVGGQFRYQNHIGPEVVGGTTVLLTKSFGLLVDGKAYFGDREPYDSVVKTSFGLVWRF